MLKVCQSKIEVTSKSGEKHAVGCGVCYICRKKRLRSWIHRISVEEEASVSSFFVTLTYDNKNIEFTEKTDNFGNVLFTLNKETFQKFMKLVRYYENEQHKKNGTSAPPIKYYAVGEYGGKFHRPHYHILIFNLVYWHSSLTQAWDKGNIHIGEVTPESTAYTLSYVTDKTFKTFEGDPRQKPFSLCSQGIGKSYLTAQTVDYHKNHEALFATLKGQKYPLADYYKKRIWTDPKNRTKVGEKIALELQDKQNQEDKEFIKNFGQDRFNLYLWDKKMQLWRKEQERKVTKNKALD